jgi:hypothetical protein
MLGPRVPGESLLRHIGVYQPRAADSGSRHSLATALLDQQHLPNSSRFPENDFSEVPVSHRLCEQYVGSLLEMRVVSRLRRLGMPLLMGGRDKHPPFAILLIMTVKI